MKGKKVLVTGADGFIGSHLVEMLLHEGANVRALCQYNSFNHWGWLEDVQCLKEVDVVCGDVRDPNFCLEITKGIDIIFHLAALIAIPYSYIAPNCYVDTNVSGTLNICQAARTNQCLLIHTSTSEVYGSAQYVPIDEKHPLQPQSPYSASKIAADSMAMSFHNAFELPVIIARPFNTFGPRQSARAVIPTIISQIANGSSEIKLGDVSPLRDFNYVEDTCRGFIVLASCLKAIGKTVNIGSGREISILDTFKLIKNTMKSDVKLVQDEARLRPEKSEVNRLCCDNTFINKLTGYIPKVSFSEGIMRTCEWFLDKDNISHYKMDIYNI